MKIVNVVIPYKEHIQSFFNNYVIEYLNEKREKMLESEHYLDEETDYDEISENLYDYVYDSLIKLKEINKKEFDSLFGLICLSYIYVHTYKEASTKAYNYLCNSDLTMAMYCFDNIEWISIKIIEGFIQNVQDNDYDYIFQRLIDADKEEMCKRYYPEYKLNIKLMEYNTKISSTRLFVYEYLKDCKKNPNLSFNDFFERIVNKDILSDEIDQQNLYESALLGYYTYTKALALEYPSGIDNMDKEVLTLIEDIETTDEMVNKMIEYPIVARKIVKTYFSYLELDKDSEATSIINKQEEETGYVKKYIQEKRLNNF